MSGKLNAGATSGNEVPPDALLDAPAAEHERVSADPSLPSEVGETVALDPAGDDQGETLGGADLGLLGLAELIQDETADRLVFGRGCDRWAQDR